MLLDARDADDVMQIAGEGANRNQEQNRRRRFQCGVLVSLLLVAVTIGLIVWAVSKHDHDDDSDDHSSSHWTYAMQGAWSGVCTTGARQSPIAINDEDTVANVGALGASLNCTYHGGVVRGTAVNNGHTIQLNVADIATCTDVPSFDANTTMRLAQLHFHWRSEHWTQGRPHALEVHLVHFNTKYASLTVTTHM